MDLDLTLQALLPPLDADLATGFDSFVTALSALSKTALVSHGWVVEVPRKDGDSAVLDPFSDRQAALDWFAWRDAQMGPEVPPLAGFSVHAGQPNASGAARAYEAKLTWSGLSSPAFVFDIWRAPPTQGADWQLYVKVIETLVLWTRPQHVFAMPTQYMVSHWPLDRLRKGIGWLGWVPFEIAPAHLPEAAYMRPFAGGTTIVGQETLWQADNAEAVASAQALDIRLNMLGLLPRHVELQSGTWGQR